jgi:hypothetical protein
MGAAAPAILAESGGRGLITRGQRVVAFSGGSADGYRPIPGPCLYDGFPAVPGG